MATRSSSTAPPLSVGRFELSGRIGSGSTGMLYRARDKETHNFVSVQLIPTEGVERSHYDRLEAEFHQAARLEHPNVLRLLDFGRESAFLYIATEWIEGTVLSQMIQAHTRLSEELAVRIVAQISQAIDYLLLGNYANYLVRTSTIVVRTDGLAKLVTFAPALGCLPSSPMPGLALASSSPLDAPLHDPAKARVEDPVCALAETLYEMLTGREWHPAEPSGARRSSSRRRRPSAMPGRIPGLSERLELAIRRATDHDPQKRPASCVEFATLLLGRARAVGNVRADNRLTTADSDNRRAFVRYAIGIGSLGTIHNSALEPPRPDSPKSQEVWPLVVRDLSAGGVGLLLARWCEVGTELLIDLPAGREKQARTLPVRVVRIKRENHGHWAHGCQFLKALDEQELSRLLDHAAHTGV